MQKTNLELKIDEALLADIYQANDLFNMPGSPVRPTDIYRDSLLSDQFGADIWLVSELRQPIGAYKIRGAWNFMHNLTEEDKKHGVITASAGNHAQGVALACNYFDTHATVFMPETTPENKVKKVEELGGLAVDVVLSGKTYDDSEEVAREFKKENGALFVHPFNDRKIVAGQGTLGVEILKSLPELDTLVCPVGGGGLIAGIGTVLKANKHDLNLIGVEPSDAPSMQSALAAGEPVTVEIDTFVDGAAVKKVGGIPFKIAKELIDKMVTTDRELLRETVTYLWSRGVRAELAGSLAVAAIRLLSDEVKNKQVGLIISGGNLSSERFEREIRI